MSRFLSWRWIFTFLTVGIFLFCPEDNLIVQNLGGTLIAFTMILWVLSIK